MSLHRWIFFWMGSITLLAQDSQAICSGTTCGECISSGFNCAWCSQKNFTATRCQQVGQLMSDGCTSDQIENPTTSVSFLQDDDVQDATISNPHAVQIRPQRVSIITRPRKEQKVSMVFRAANNFPVDLYFLFDNSLSMKSQIKNLAKLTDDIGRSIGYISSNYQMGYGIFQDKVIMPFTDTTPIKKLNPCATTRSSRTCSPPFEFKHLLSMTRDVEAFKDKVNKTGVTGNLDHPEGSADAIMQAVTCKSEIGWRNVSRKMLIFASNDRFHLAGDGKLAGIVLPNDGSCHLDSEGRYSKELEQDYPSVSQLTDSVERNEVHVIFAVSQDQVNLFKHLSRRIPQSIVELMASPDDPNNRNIQEIIEKKYKEMISEVEIVHNEVEGVEIQIKAKSPECERLDTNKCKGLEIGRSINFEVSVKVNECPKKPEDRKKTVVIHPESMKTYQLILEIDIVCECDCSTNYNKWELNSDICNRGNGTLKCGLCDCHDDRFGQFCECDPTELDTSNSGCLNPGENSTKECSGAGECVCGVCKCDEGYSGPYCECNDLACGSFKRELCGGVRGRCICGECVCESGYSGNTCECSTSNSTCLYDGTICNDAGTCTCGECSCKSGYIGKYCENCFLCGDSVCDIPQYRECAECAISLEKDNCPMECPDIQLVDAFEDSDGSGVCSLKQADGCFLSFQITSSDANVTIFVQKTTNCPEPVDILPIALGVVGGVVAIGLLLLLLWKLLTSIFDKIEYSKFQEDLKQCKWAQQDNPFYKGATTTYKNPMLDTSEPLTDDK